MKKIVFITFVIWLYIGKPAPFCNELDNIIKHAVTNNISLNEYVKSEEFLKKKSIYKEELNKKFKEMISNDDYSYFFQYLILALEISDKRYIPLLSTIERKIGSYAGINIIGYSKFMELKINKSSVKNMITELVNQNIGPSLLNDVVIYSLSNTNVFHEKLVIFKTIAEKVDYKYYETLTEVIYKLCNENYKETQDFIKKNRLLEKIDYDCNYKGN